MVNKLYVLIRDDLTPSQQAVQACHAVGEFMRHDNVTWPNETIVLLKTKDLGSWFARMDDIADSWVEFCEPDIGNQMTAIAAWGPNCPRAFKNLPLL